MLLLSTSADRSSALYGGISELSSPQNQSANEQMQRLAPEAGLCEAASLYTFRRDAGARWAEELGMDFARQLLGHGRQKDVTALHYTRDVLHHMDMTAMSLGEGASALPQAIDKSTVLSLAAPAGTAIAV